MVGRNSSMLLMAFCITMSNTHSRGRHSSSISLVDDTGKYLGNSRENTHTPPEKVKTGMSTNRCRQAKNDWRYKNTHTLIYSTQLNCRSKQYIIPRTNCMITEDEDLQSAAFDQSLQNVVHRAANKQREEVCVRECVFVKVLCSHYPVRSSCPHRG